MIETTLIENKNIDYIPVLKKIPEFSILDPEHLKKIASIVSIKEYLSGSIVFRENEMGDAFYIILSGEVQIFVTNEENVEVTLLTLYSMDSFGEIGFITGKPRSASSKTVRESKLLVIKKNDFDEVLEHNSSLTRTFINILGHRLKTDNERALEQSSRKHELRQFWVERGALEPITLIGKSKHIQELKEFSRKAAENNLPVLLIGERGTGKLVRAQYIFENSRRNKERYLTVDCAAIREISTDQDGESEKKNDILLGLSQESTLFGHLRGALSFAKTRRLGYIEVAEGGTIVIDNVEKLTMGVQNKMLIYLKTGYYMRIGSSEQIKSDVKIIFTADANIEELAKKGYFNKELYNFLIRQSISLLPIRERKRDIHDLVEHFIEEYSKLEGKRVVGITKEAMNALLGYDWPNNIDQLKSVVYKAVNLTEGDVITPSHIFIGPIITEKARGFNLLKFDAVRKFIESRAYPDIFRNVIAAGYILITLLLLFGFNGYDKKTVLLVWAIGWPLLLISIIFTSRLFCGLCPMRAIAETIQKKVCFNLKLPNFIKGKGPFIGVFGFALILSIEHIINMPDEPLFTAYLLLAILGFAVIFSILFDRAIWCRHLCPLGQMNGVYAKLSIIEIRANTSVCSSECRIPTCYNGTDKNKGCPMYLGVFNMHTNENCIMCGLCVKNCTHRSVRLNFRAPAAELFRNYGLDSYRKGKNLAIAFFLPALIAGALSMNFAELFPFDNLVMGINNRIFHYTVFYIFFYLLCLGLIWFGAAFTGHDTGSSSLERFVWFACSFIPVAFAGEIANQIITFINGFGQIAPEVHLQMGQYIINILSHQESTGMVKFFQINLIIMGAIASIFSGKRAVEKAAQEQGDKKYGQVYIINAVFCFFLIFVFMWR